jgi:hypothetical protein
MASFKINAPVIPLGDDCLDFVMLKKSLEFLPTMCSEAINDSSPNYRLANLTPAQREGKTDAEQYTLALDLASAVQEKPETLADPDLASSTRLPSTMRRVPLLRK